MDYKPTVTAAAFKKCPSKLCLHKLIFNFKS